MKRKKLVLIGAIVIAIGASLFTINNKSNESKEIGIQDIKQLVNDYSIGNLQAKSASITSQQLFVTHVSNKKRTYNLPENEFFVSIAPYIQDTHPCSLHNLSGCRGELAEKEFDVYVEDSNGNVILDQSLKSHANGFIDLWLPRKKTYSIKISQDGKTVESEVSTFEGDNTCITTMQLM